MTTTTQTTPKIFISYSWSSPAHEDWVIALAQRLVSDGVEVVFDKWDLKKGHDKYVFMESSVKATDIQKVLIISDKAYAEKADKRSGGVGTETQIISPEIYTEVKQEKFIPIVRERDEDRNAYLPAFLASRIYIDFTDNDKFEASYEELLRDIYQRPSHKKPALGVAPNFLFEESKVRFKTSQLVRGIEARLVSHPKRINAFLKEFLDEFYTNLTDFRVTFTERDNISIGKAIHDNIVEYTDLRDDFLQFLENLFKYGEEKLDVDVITNFLTQLLQLTSPAAHIGSWYEYQYDNFRFIIHELFISLIAICLKNEKYDLAAELLYSTYFTSIRYDGEQNESFEIFYKPINSIDAYYTSTYNVEYISSMAKLITDRIPALLTKDLVIESDLLCYYMGELNNIGGSNSSFGITWFPITYIYQERRSINFFKKLISKRYFEKVKVIFDVNTPAELSERINKYEQVNKDKTPVRHGRTAHTVIPIHKAIDREKIATAR